MSLWAPEFEAGFRRGLKQLRRLNAKCYPRKRRHRKKLAARENYRRYAGHRAATAVIPAPPCEWEYFTT